MVLDHEGNNGQDILEPVVMILTGYHTLQQALAAVRESGIAQADHIGRKLREGPWRCTPAMACKQVVVNDASATIEDVCIPASTGLLE
jgi:hypothetical protein